MRINNNIHESFLLTNEASSSYDEVQKEQNVSSKYLILPKTCKMAKLSQKWSN